MARHGVLTEQVTEVVDHLGDLVDRLPAGRAAEARRTLRARTMDVRKGRWDAVSDGEMVTDGIGFLVLEGALVRCVTAGHRTSGELLGPGDIIRPEHDANI